MSRTRSTESHYQRGAYRLTKRPDRANYDITWYDQRSKRQRSRSAGSGDLGSAKESLDRFYLQREKGQAVCPTCGKPWEDKRRFLLMQSMLDYDAARRSRPSYDAIYARLGHVHAYLAATAQTDISCEDIEEDWIENFWEWAIEIPVVSPSGNVRSRAPGTVNNSVLQLAAAINFSHKRRDTLFAAAFRPKQPDEVNRTPTYRSDIKQIAAMFAYALEYPVKRRNLLNFLRASVVTLIRPEHAHYLDVSPKAGMWQPGQNVFNLLPRGQMQTKKRRPEVPIARQAIPWLNSETGQLVTASSIKSAWNRMQTELGLPGEGQAGPKLIRRSMANLVRQRIDRRDTPELELFLGHRTVSTVTDLYAPHSPDYLARARAAIESVVDEIEAVCSTAFHRTNTAEVARVVSIGVAKSG